MKIQCPHCKYVHKVADDMFGRKVICPKCTKPFGVIEKYHTPFACKVLGVLIFVIGFFIAFVAGVNLPAGCVTMVIGILIAAINK